MIVVADTTVFLNLACIRQERLLVLLFQQVFAPPQVRAEFERAAQRWPRFENLHFPAWVIVRASTLPIIPIPGPPLDPGETMAIALAAESKAEAILVDEKAGRRAAESLGLIAFATVGVLLRAKASGHISLVAPVLESLACQANFYLDVSAKTAALVLAGENPGDPGTALSRQN